MSFTDSLTAPEKRAVALIGLMIKMHGGHEGEGMFTGVSRYAVLEQRVRLAAERSRTVQQCWDNIARNMRWNVGPVKWDDAALALIRPQDDDADTLRALCDRTQSVVMIARTLTRREKAALRSAQEPLPDIPELNDPLDIFNKEPANTSEGEAV